jgi:hypothetical protein
MAHIASRYFPATSRQLYLPSRAQQSGPKIAMSWEIILYYHSMTTTFDSPYLKSTIFPESSLVVSQWANGQNATDDDYKISMAGIANLMISHKPLKRSLMITDLSFTITPELQEWTNEHVTGALLAAGALPERTAFVVPPTAYQEMLITMLSIEQTVEQSQEAKPLEYFDDEAKARAWLMA